MEDIVKDCKWLFEQFDTAKGKEARTSVLEAIENKAMIYAAVHFDKIEKPLGLKYNDKNGKLYV